MSLTVVGCCVGLAALSVLRRIRARMSLSQAELPREPIPGPVSEAMKDLVAVAGGIYLSLLMITSFLALDVPGVVGFGAVAFEPLAGLAFLLAVLQPFIGDLIRWCRGV